jgi:hypothetical protein
VISLREPFRGYNSCCYKLVAGKFLAGEEASPWAWKGGDAVSVSWTFAGNDAMEALNELVKRIRVEVEAYRQKAMSLDDLGRIERATDMMDWLSGTGSSVVAEIHTSISDAEPERKHQMGISLQSATRLADTLRPRDSTAMDDWDTVLQWAEDILLVVRRAFRRYPSGEARHGKKGSLTVDTQFSDVMKVEPVGVLTYQVDLPEVNTGPCEHGPVAPSCYLTGGAQSDP